MARSSNTEARRAEITGALLAVIARHGYEKATIQAIAAQAGLAPGLIHYHFRSKQELFSAIVSEVTRLTIEEWSRVTQSSEDPAEAFRALARHGPNLWRPCHSR